MTSLRRRSPHEWLSGSFLPGKVNRGIVITRPEPGLGETLAAVEQAGWRGYASPALVVQPRAMASGGANGRGRPIAALLLTSGQAVAAVAQALPMGINLAVPVFAVGARTAERARAAGFTQVCSADGDATALAVLLRQRLAPEAGPLLLACGAGQGGALADALRTDGFRVLRRVAYDTRAARRLPPEVSRALLAGRIEVVAFFSAQSAKSWFDGLRDSALRAAAVRTVALVLSSAIEKSVRALGWEGPVIVAARPDATSMLEALEQVRRQGATVCGQ